MLTVLDDIIIKISFTRWCERRYLDGQDYRGRMMYEIIKNKIGTCVYCSARCLWYSWHFARLSRGNLASGYFDTNYQRTREQLERTQRALDASRKLNQQLREESVAANQRSNSDAGATSERGSRISTKQGQEWTREINEVSAELAKASNISTRQEERLKRPRTPMSGVREQIKRNKRTEQRLKRQRTIWGVVAARGF